MNYGASSFAPLARNCFGYLESFTVSPEFSIFFLFLWKKKEKNATRILIGITLSL